MYNIKYTTPPGFFFTSGEVPINGKIYPFLIFSNSFQYVELHAKVDEKPPIRIATWCDPYSPHFYVVYQPEVLNGKNVELIITMLPRGVYPKY